MSAIQVAQPDSGFLALLTPAARERLLSSSRRVDYPAGSVFYQPGQGDQVLIVARGLVRIYFQDIEGRQATVLFVRENALAGVLNVLGETPDLFGQAVVKTSTLVLDHGVFRDLVNGDLATARAMAAYTAMRLRKTFELVGLRTLGSIRQRLAYDLLERASRAQLQTSHLRVDASQTELADSIGTSREVAGRALAVFRAEGLITTGRGLVRIEDPMRLANIVRDFTV